MPPPSHTEDGAIIQCLKTQSRTLGWTTSAQGDDFAIYRWAFPEDAGSNFIILKLDFSVRFAPSMSSVFH